MNRATALTLLAVAGYHEDKTAFVRLYVENRISFANAQKAYASGKRARTNGVPCTCGECKKESTL